MKFVKHLEADESLDLVCRMCPMHLLEPGDKLKCMRKGQVLEVLTDCDGAPEDIPDWCKKCGHKFIGMEEDNALFQAGADALSKTIEDLVSKQTTATSGYIIIIDSRLSKGVMH